MTRNKLPGRIAPVIIALMLSALALVFSGCTQVERIPTLSADNVRGFWIGPSSELTADILANAPAPAEPLDGFVAAFNEARKNAWLFQPPAGLALNIVMLVGQSGQVLVSLSPEYPEGHAVVGVLGVGEEMGAAEGVTWYWVKAPALVRAATAMARDTLGLDAILALDPTGEWLYADQGVNP